MVAETKSKAAVPFFPDVRQKKASPKDEASFESSLGKVISKPSDQATSLSRPEKLNVAGSGREGDTVQISESKPDRINPPEGARIDKPKLMNREPFFSKKAYAVSS